MSDEGGYQTIMSKWLISLTVDVVAELKEQIYIYVTVNL
jgi:hypothetical protein